MASGSEKSGQFDLMATFGAIFVALSAAGAVVEPFRETDAAVWVSLSVYAFLISLFVFGTEAGTRTSWPAYVLGVFVYFVAGAIILSIAIRSDAHWLGALVLGTNVGWVPPAEADPSPRYYLPWIFSIYAPLILILLGRTVAR